MKSDINKEYFLIPHMEQIDYTGILSRLGHYFDELHEIVGFWQFYTDDLQQVIIKITKDVCRKRSSNPNDLFSPYSGQYSVMVQKPNEDSPSSKEIKSYESASAALEAGIRDFFTYYYKTGDRLVSNPDFIGNRSFGP